MQVVSKRMYAESCKWEVKQGKTKDKEKGEARKEKEERKKSTQKKEKLMRPK